MARYGNQPQGIVDMYNPINLELYSNLMGQAQTNLNQGAAMQAKFLEDIYGQKYLDKATRDAQVGKAEQAVSGLLDADFISPASVIKGVSKASQGLAPWRNLNEKQLELAKQADAFKLQHGANALMTDIAKESLSNEDGSLKTPEQLKFTGLNAEDIDKIFLTSEKGELTSKFDRKVKSDLPFKYKFETVEGLSPQEIEQRYGREGADAIRLAEQQIQASPQILDVFDGDKDKAIEYLRNRNLSTAGQFGQSVTSKYVDDDWSLYMAKQRQETAAKPVSPNVPFYPVDGMVKPSEGRTTGAQMMKASGGREEVNWDKATFNKEGNLTTQGWVEDTSLGYKAGDKYTPKKLINNPQYKEAADQLFNLKQSLVKQGLAKSYTDISDKDAIGMMKQAVDNSVIAYGLQNEAVGDMFKGDNFDAFTDSDGNFKAANNAELEYFDKKKNKWVQSTLEGLSDELGWEGATPTATGDKNLTAQLSKGTSKELEYSSGKPMSVRTVLDPKGNPVTVRSRLGNKAAETFGKPYAQAQNMLTEPGKHTLEFNGLSIDVEVQPSTVTSPNGEQQLVNRIVNLKFDGEIDNAYNKEAIAAIYAAKSPEKALINFTRNYRDNMYENKQIIKKVESTKK
jgi:hypothetical protein